jgi:hypothetical protein
VLSMLKIAYSLLLMGSMLVPLIGMAQPVKAQESSNADGEVQVVPVTGYLGVCELNTLSGLSIIDDETGEVRMLADYCPTETATRLSLSEEGENFWQAFLSVASPRAIDFAARTNRQEVANYGATVCVVLDEGSSLQEVRRLQIEGGLPPSFDAAVNVAAINTYCPQYRAEIGR